MCEHVCVSVCVCLLEGGLLPFPWACRSVSRPRRLRPQLITGGASAQALKAGTRLLRWWQGTRCPLCCSPVALQEALRPDRKTGVCFSDPTRSNTKACEFSLAFVLFLPFASVLTATSPTLVGQVTTKPPFAHRKGCWAYTCWVILLAQGQRARPAGLMAGNKCREMGDGLSSLPDVAGGDLSQAPRAPSQGMFELLI